MLGAILSDPSFIHLRVHSSYSLAEGAIKITEEKTKDGRPSLRRDLIQLCIHHRMPAVALTDKGNLFGALEFSMAAVAAGIQPIIGCQISVMGTTNTTQKFLNRDSFDQLVLLVQNELGYRNLSALVTKSFLTKDRSIPYVTIEEIALHSGGLLALSGGIEGALGHLLLAGQANAAEVMTEKFKKIFPDRFYIELTRHPGSSLGEIEVQIEGKLVDIAYRHSLPLIATNDVYFGDEDMYVAHDALLCISEKTIVVEQNRRRLSVDYRFKSAAEMRTLFADLPEACDNTVVVAKRCGFMPPERKPILPTFPTENGRDEAEELRAQATKGLDARLASLGSVDAKIYLDRLNYELKVIINMGFSGYFLIVSDFIKWAKFNSISVGPGRGSGAGSVVAWSLLITDLDPIQFGLLFERFLNPERISMPDFDIDFCQERRDEVIQYVQQKYGADKVAQIITFGKLQARAALRDVGRVLAMSYGYIDKICKLVPNNPANPVTLAQAIEGEAQLQQLRREDPMVAQLMDIALKLEGLYRNASTHAAGVVIGDRPLVDLVPLYRDPDAALPATQFNLKTVEAAGLVKFDFLGLKTLDILQNAVELLKSNGINIDLAHLPLKDPKTFHLLTKGDTTGVFQLESSGMRDVLRKLRPDRFEDIIALVALYRPGPMDNIPKYIKCKNGDESPNYLHPLLRPILEDTFGILIYQEQVMQSAQILAGYSLGAADLLRRAMGKKKASEMAAQRADFIKGANRNQVSDDQAGMIFDQIDKFAGYGFNKSHAAAYALIAYQTAWLKANHPVEFFTAAMNFERGDTDKLNIFRQELLRNHIPLLPPDINKSRVLFSVEKTETGLGIRYGLAAIKGVGDSAMHLVVGQREKVGLFKDLFDFSERVDPRVINRKQLENLISAGAFDIFNRNRAQNFSAIEILLKHSHHTHDERGSGQSNMFANGQSSVRPPLPTTKPWDELTRLQHEFQTFGFYFSAHPLDNFRPVLNRLGVVSSAEVSMRQRATGPSRYKLAGIVLSRQERTSKQGNKFAFIQLSDATGAFEVTVFSELLASKRELLEGGQAVLMDVDAQTATSNAAPGSEGVELRFLARSIEKLSSAAERASLGLTIKVETVDILKDLKKCLANSPSGKGRIYLQLALENDEEAEIELPGGWQLTENLKSSLRQIGTGLELGEY